MQWAKKRFIESDLAWVELEQDQFLLPDGELKNLLAGIAETKALPPASVGWNELRSRGLEYAKTLKAPSERLDTVHVMPVCNIPSVVDVDGRRRDLQRQKELILQRHPPTAKEPIHSPVKGNRCD